MFSCTRGWSVTVPSSLSVFPSSSTISALGATSVAGHLPDDLEDAAVIVQGVGRIDRGGVLPGRGVGEIVLLDPRHLGQRQVIEEEQDVFVIEKEVRHGRPPQSRSHH